ncbi:hypothetical protein SAMN06297129_2450 [Pseudooceanicola antarcticus]|uniref:Uncharacterized protein n=1 Tax=Pseudooceanicola antarcticus TaxID=1247613 RepID=A0A285IY97_9RHOB|nr:hypothetical protein [Pseudooceanicola antarcticus]PJE25763.1 hypothetical protein CVM39_18840 [Pseudooceanicola antarcticus]SNY52954.1 hypothetical protein SAMN06297129_2450 [Pseudooceanicola antarcticus]
MSGFSAPPPSLPLSLADAPTGEELSLEHVGAGLAGIFWRGVKMLEFGMSLTDMNGNEIQAPLGMAGETWQSVSRSNNTNYHNTTGRPIVVTFTGNGANVRVSTDAANWVTVGASGGGTTSHTGTTIYQARGSAIIPPNHYYRFSSASDFAELRQ